MKKQRKNKKSKINTIRELVIKTLKANAGKEFNYKQVSAKLSIKNEEKRKLINTLLIELARQEIIEETEIGKYKFKPYKQEIIGKLHIVTSGIGFVEVEELTDDIFISREKLKGALNGDTVKVKLLTNYNAKNRKKEGKVIEIIKRAKDHFIGIVTINQNFAFLEPTESNVPFDIFIPKSKINGAKQGDKAIAKITSYSSSKKNPEGIITEVLGKPLTNNVEMHAILAEFGLPRQYPQEAIDEAEKIPDEITQEEIGKRKDFRNTTTFTIDPHNAKDFDDAISFKKLQNQNYQIGVHIADVSHYITPNSIIDQEAYSRATSIYLPDRTVPMLPERLSNFICSLRPNEDKLCYSIVFEISPQAEIINQWIGRTIINSDRRFTYKQAQKIIDSQEGEYANEITELNNIAMALRKNRFKNGAIDFERSEMGFKLDKNGKPLEIVIKQTDQAHQLIEELMLLANKRIAEFIAKKDGGKYKQSFVYRIHEDPDPEKLNAFFEFANKLGYDYHPNNNQNPATKLNNFLKEVKGSELQNIIELMAVQSMAKARYTTQNCGHFGLAFPYYTHFTSPIRRYPDLMVHRLLTEYLKNEKPEDNILLEEKCKHSLEQETLSVNAERAAIKYKQIEFLQDKLGYEFDATIINVTNSGMYIALTENSIEGFISAKNMTDDYYEYIESEYCLLGNRTNRKYTIGDKVRVQLIKADLLRRYLDFQII